MRYTINNKGFNTKKEIKEEVFRIFNNVQEDFYSKRPVEVTNKEDNNFIKELISKINSDIKIESFLLRKGKFGIDAIVNNKYGVKLQDCITQVKK